MLIYTNNWTSMFRLARTERFMERHYKIKEVASLFGIPVSTLHYWESTGLFEVTRNKENRYREYGISDILSIWEIMLYRELDLPIQEVKKILEQDVEVQDAVYKESEQDIERQIRLLKEKKKKIQMQRKLIHLLEEVRQKPLTMTEPDLSICKIDPFDMESMTESLANPYLSMIHITGTAPREYCRGIALPPNCEEEVLWRKEEGDSYMEFLFKMKFNEPSKNNLKEIQESLEQQGYQTGEVIARYLLSANEGAHRMEYFRAWMKVKGKDIK